MREHGTTRLDADAPRPRWVEAAVFVVPLLLYGLLRAWLLGGWYERIDTEELEFGLFPAHLLTGLLAPVPAYQTMVREGGSIQLAVTHAPVFAVAGPSYLALKAAGAVLHGLVLLVWVGVARLGLGRLPALVLGLLLALSPPFLARMDVMGWANHGEGNLLAGLALLGLLLAVRWTDSHRWRSRAAGLVAGIACGLGVTFAFTVLPMAMLLVGLAVRNARGAAARAWLPMAVGCVLGVVPWAVCVEAVHGVDRLREMVGLGGMGAALGQDVSSAMFDHRDAVPRVVQLLGLDLFRMWGFTAGDGSYRSVLNHLFGAVVLVWAAAWAGSRWRVSWGVARRGGGVDSGAAGVVTLVAVVPPAHGLGFLAAIVVSGLGGAFISPDDFDGYRYLLPLFPPLLMCAAAGLVHLLRTRAAWSRITALCTLAVAVPLLVWGQLSLPAHGPSLTGQLKGYHLRNLEQALLERPRSWRLDAWEDHPADRWELAMIEGRAAIRGEPGLEPDEQPAPSCPFPEALACTHFWEGVGLELAWASEYGQGSVRDASVHLERLRARGDAEGRLALAYGLGRGYGFGLAAAEVDALLQADELAWFVRGMGGEAVRGAVVPAWFGGDFDRRTGFRAYALWCEGLGIGLARCLMEPASAPVVPVAPRAWAPLLASDLDRAAFERGYAQEREKLARP